MNFIELLYYDCFVFKKKINRTMIFPQTMAQLKNICISLQCRPIYVLLAFCFVDLVLIDNIHSEARFLGENQFGDWAEISLNYNQLLTSK